MAHKMAQEGVFWPSAIRLEQYWYNIKITWTNIVNVVLDVGI